ncbi:MAG TPA: xanthine dehydrogenase molybdopterin binding subunit [Symbiobacteriaceae bacterium]|nr:xanthine dehydrogenase molybdopterin binding subunit [Symbiobacteriaceae bacterium]
MSVHKPLPHESAIGHVTGAARYVEDLAGRFPDLLWAWPVQAPHARARLVGLDLAAAQSHPGVVHVLTIDDLRGENEVGHGDEPLFVTDEVAYHGQAVAWVLAESREAARQGAQLVRAEYEPLTPIRSIEEAITQASFHGGLQSFGRGEPDRAIAQAPFRLTGEVRIGGQEHFYLETQASLAMIDEAGLMQVHSSTQHPAETGAVVARVLGWPVNQVVVQTLRLGGGFGGKESQAAPYAAVAALGACVSPKGRPVLVRLGRGEDMTLTGKRHPFLARFAVGFDGDGRLQGLNVELWSDGGWSTDLSPAILSRALLHLDNAYQIPHLRATGQVCRTNKASNTAFRGFGGPQGMLVIEEIMSRVAAYLDLPPHLVRERNLYRKGDLQAALSCGAKLAVSSENAALRAALSCGANLAVSSENAALRAAFSCGAKLAVSSENAARTHYGQPVRDVERITQIWTDLKATSRFEERLAEVAAFNEQSPHVKRGLALTPVKFGISFTLTHLNQAGALVLIYQDGSVQVNHGGTEMGQGLHTKIAQIAADSLGVPLPAIRVMPTRTDKVPNASATAASSGTDLNGAAVREACLALRERLTGVAAGLWEVDPSAVTCAAGVVSAPGQSLPFAELVKLAYEQRVQLFATGFYRTPEIFYSKEQGEGSPFRYFAWGAAVSEVELDGFTGQSTIRSVEILHDCGDSINPLIDRGQVEGGFVQGLGWLTQEELVWDEQGRLLTKGASTYKLPGANWLPERFEIRFLERATEPGAVLGAKAVGEPPLMLALSVREALRAAVAAFGGPIEIDSPLTPERLFWACHEQKDAVD